MKTIKTFLAVTLVLFSCITFAQPPGGGQQGPPPVPNSKQIKEMVSELARQISLNDVQETSVIKLYTEHFEAVKAKTSGNTRPKREEMEDLKTNFEKSIKVLLTADQQKAYEAFLKKQNFQNTRR